MTRNVLRIRFNRRQSNFDTAVVELRVFAFLFPQAFGFGLLFCYIRCSFILIFLVRFFVFFFSKAQSHILTRVRVPVVGLILHIELETQTIFQSWSLTLLLFIRVALFGFFLSFWSIAFSFFFIHFFFVNSKEIRVTSSILQLLSFVKDAIFRLWWRE